MNKLVFAVISLMILFAAISAYRNDVTHNNVSLSASTVKHPSS